MFICFQCDCLRQCHFKVKYYPGVQKVVAMRITQVDRHKSMVYNTCSNQGLPHWSLETGGRRIQVVTKTGFTLLNIPCVCQSFSEVQIEPTTSVTIMFICFQCGRLRQCHFKTLWCKKSGRNPHYTGGRCRQAQIYGV